ncbi:MAG: ABC transporter six-transmembrane domain-containing protein [Pseudomonadota bacterium]
MRSPIWPFKRFATVFPDDTRSVAEMTKSTTNIAPSTDSKPGAGALTLTAVFRRFRWRISFTVSLVVVETLLDLLYPLFIGWAISDLLYESFNGIYLLVGLGSLSLLIGSARRFYDTRIYAHIYQVIAPEMVAKEKDKSQSVSTIAARSSLLTELVEFFENALPEVITVVIGVVGVLIIVSTLNVDVFFACLALLLLIVIVYSTVGSLNYRLNAGYNTELEKQVEMIKQLNISHVRSHFERLMQWNIKLSDLETGTYFVLWLGIIALFVYTPITAIKHGTVDHGLLVALLMYVFSFIEKAATLPLYVQQVIRLKEITNRINT